MNTFKEIFLTLSAITLLGTASAQTAELVADSTKKTIDVAAVSASSDIISDNMFFMMDFGGPMLRPLLVASYKNLGVGTWANYDLTKSEIVENDLFVKYTVPIKFDSTHSLNITPGIAYYTFANSTSPDVQQTEVVLSTEGFPLDASAKLAKIYNSGGAGWLFEAKVSKTTPLFEKISTTLAASAIYNNQYFTSAEGWAGIDGSIALTWNPIENLNITGMLTGQIALSDNFSEKKLGDDIGAVKDQAYFTTTVSWDF